MKKTLLCFLPPAFVLIFAGILRASEASFDSANGTLTLTFIVTSEVVHNENDVTKITLFSSHSINGDSYLFAESAFNQIEGTYNNDYEGRSLAFEREAEHTLSDGLSVSGHEFAYQRLNITPGPWSRISEDLFASEEKLIVIAVNDKKAVCRPRIDQTISDLCTGSLSRENGVIYIPMSAFINKERRHS